MKNKTFWIVGIILIAAIAVVSYFLLTDTDLPFDVIVNNDESEDYIYVEGLVGQFQRLNPLLEHLNQVDKDVNRLIFNGLIKFDQWGNPIPDLAGAWNVNLKGDVFNIALKEGVLWHDGMPFTTEDVVFTIDLIKNSEFPIPSDVADLWNAIEIVVFDDLNMQFNLPEPFIPFVDYLAFGVLPAHVLIGRSADEVMNGDFNFSPVGTGPYKFVDLKIVDNKVTEVELEQNEEFFGDLGELHYISFHYFNDDVSAFAAYQNGDIFGIGSLGLNIFEQSFSDENLNVYSMVDPELRILMINHSSSSASYLSDLALKQALYYGLNRENMIGQVLNGQAVEAVGPISPNSWAYYGNVERYEYNPNYAINILESNGYLLPAGDSGFREKGGLTISLNLLYEDNEEHGLIAAMIKEYWEGIGIQVNLKPETQNVMVSSLENGNYDVALVNLSLGDTADPDPYAFWHQAEAGNGQNYSNWDNRRGSEYLERARVTPNRVERERQYKNFQIHFSLEVPSLPLYYPVVSFAVVEEVGGISPMIVTSTSDRFNNISDWYWDLEPETEPTSIIENE